MPQYRDFEARMDSISVDDLRAAGSLKWTADPDALAAWIAEMDFGLAPDISDTIQRWAASQLTGYAPMQLRAGLKEATARFVATRYGWTVPAENVHTLPDVLSGLAIVFKHLSDTSGTVIIPTPSYMPFPLMPGAFGREQIQVPMRFDTDWYLDLDDLDRAFAQGGQILILCNPHNPIGKVYSADELADIAEVVERHHGLVFSDEIHAPLVYPGRSHAPYASVNEVTAHHTVTAMAASKAWNIAGLKCAQLVLTNPDHQRWMTDHAHGVPHDSSTLGMAASIAAYNNSREWLDHVVTYLDRNRHFITEFLADRIPELGYHVPDATYLAWLDARNLPIAAEHRYDFASFARQEAGVMLTSGDMCGDAGRGQVRMNFATPRPILQRMLNQLADAVDRHRS